MWLLFAVLSSVFAALTAILAKVGVEHVESTLATAIRTIVVLAMAWMMVFIAGSQKGISGIPTRSWWFLILSGVATGVSWLCYYKALETGPVSRVAAIDKFSVVLTIVLAVVFLHEQISWRSALGCILIGAGTLLMVLYP